MSGRLERALVYIERFGVTFAQVRRPWTLLDQLDRCKDDEARRVLLRVKQERTEDDD